MSYTPIEGVHYIFDRYAFLNALMEDGGHEQRVALDSPEEDFEVVVRLARAMHHPDRQAKAGKKKQQEAEWMSHKIGDCEKFLLNAEIKPLYDEKLASFRSHKPHMISTSGIPLVNLNEEVMDIDSLLSEKVEDSSEFEALIKTHTRYDENNTLRAKKLFDKMPDDADIRESYRNALTDKLINMNLLENVAWAKIGIHNRSAKIDGHLISSEDYLAKVDEALQNVAKTCIDSHIEQRSDSARLGMSPMPLLLAFNPAAGNEATEPAATPPASTALLDPEQLQEMMAKMKNIAHKNFEIRAEYVRDIARQKQVVLEELVTLTPMTPLNNHNLDDPVYDFYLANPGDDGVVLFKMRFNAAAATNDNPIPDGKLKVSELKTMVFDHNAFLLERNTEIQDIMIEVAAAIDRLYTAVKDRFVKPAVQPPVAPPPAP